MAEPTPIVDVEVKRMPGWLYGLILAAWEVIKDEVERWLSSVRR